MHGTPFVDEYFEEHDFDPCVFPMGSGTCGSRVYFARFFLNGQHKISVYCDQEHLTTGISGGQWVPNDFFLKHVRYREMVPSDWTPMVVPKKRRDVSLELKENIAWRTREIGFCVVSGTVPFARADDRTVYDRLRQFRKHTFDLVDAHLRGCGHVDLDDWIVRLPPDLGRRVELDRAESTIQADHVVPVRVLALMRATLNSSEIDLARTMALPLCVKCNRSRGSMLYDRERMLTYYADAHFDGDRERMKRTLREKYFDLISLNDKAARALRSA